MNKKNFRVFFKNVLCLAVSVVIFPMLFTSCDTVEKPQTTDGDSDIVFHDDGSVTQMVNVANPILAGYQADPSAYKFGGAYYIYSTTDGYVLNGNAGWPMIWKSYDFVNWEAKPMEIVNSKGYKFTDAQSYFWAPSMLHWNDTYYLFFTQGDYFTMVAESDSPEGPFTVLGNLFGTTNATRPKNKTIDAQAFLDDDGKAYLVYLLRENDTQGDAALYTAICELDPDNLTKVKHIEKIEELSHSYREGQEILKRDGKYYMLYSEGSWMNDTYHVKYAMADSIYGPYTVKETILSSPGDHKIVGTGHHSTIKDGDRYIMVYHRQGIPFLGFGFRQVCADEMIFNDDGTIMPVTATYEGIKVPYKMSREEYELSNVAKGAEVTVNDVFERKYGPDLLVDGDNSTLWKSKDREGDKVLTIDLKGTYSIARTEICFEYASKFYYYKIETSEDGENWTLYADHTEDKTKESPRIDKAEGSFVTAGYLRLTITGSESMARNYGSKNSAEPERWKEPARIGIFEFRVMGKESK